MLTVEGKVDVRCTLEDAWDLFTRFSDIARLIPTVEDVEVDGEHVHARVSTKLGALPISSRVTLRVVETDHLTCLKAEGFSYLGETIKEQIKKDIEGVAKDSAGRLFLRLDLRRTDEEGIIEVVYKADVEAKGRLKRIYKAILKTKVPDMMEQFAQNLREELERAPEPVAELAEALPVVAPEERAPVAVIEEEEPPIEKPMPAALAPRPSDGWSRLIAWLRRVFRPLWGSS